MEKPESAKGGEENLAEKAKEFFQPADKNDYVTIWKWQICKKLFLLFSLLIGGVGLLYLACIYTPGGSQTGKKLPVYSYRSIPLKFVNGKVKIKAEEGYIAYEGKVKKGFAQGKGKLYSPDGNLIYEGNFSGNQYQGEGTLYYANGNKAYEGSFSDNRFHGEGILYDENGVKAYEGGFQKGKKEGEGSLFDTGGKKIFTGAFHGDRIVYTEFLGKTTQELSEAYEGKKTVYMGEDGTFAVAMEEIGVLYQGESDEAALDDSMKTDGIYVLENHIQIENREYSSIKELLQFFKEPLYQGNVRITTGEAAALLQAGSSQDAVLEAASVEMVQEYDDVFTITDYDREYLTYIYTFEKNQVRYTFYCREKDGGFGMYLLEKGGEGEETE